MNKPTKNLLVAALLTVGASFAVPYREPTAPVAAPSVKLLSDPEIFYAKKAKLDAWYENSKKSVADAEYYKDAINSLVKRTK